MRKICRLAPTWFFEEGTEQISIEFQYGRTFTEATTEHTFILVCPGMSGVRPKAVRTFSAEEELLEEIQL